MIAKGERKSDQSRLGPIDSALMAVGSCLAVYSGGMAIGKGDVALFFVYATLAGTVISLAFRTLLAGSSALKVDGILYAGAVLSAPFLAVRLNAALPNEGFPREVITAAVLCWMIVFGSALAWRDGTLLFQAIPSVALFGLVGCYDTYTDAPALFFGFLVCLATLMSRAHSREMLKQAIESGYFNRADAPSAPSDTPEFSTELFVDIKKGPWRWLAGPEWALASALAVVFISVLGAPVVKLAAEPVSGYVKIAAPRVRSAVTTRAAETQPTGVKFGQGPLGPLSPQAVYEAKLDQIRYLRASAYDVYQGNQWQQGIPATGVGVSAARELVGLDRTKTREYEFVIRTVLPTRVIPIPIETLRVEGPDVRIRIDGGGEAVGEGRTMTVRGKCIEATGTPEKAYRKDPDLLFDLLDTTNVTVRVANFAKQAAGEGTDYEKAMRLKTAIAQQVQYNLRAPAIPAGRDPIETFLFETREGYCDLFASTMVTTARSLGIPARYVIGYLPEAKNRDSAGNTIVREADYHAWAELLFEGVGWVVFDATEGAREVPGSGRGSSGDETGSAWWQSGAFRQILNGLLAIAALIGGFFLWQVVRRATARRDARTELEKAYLRFERAVRHACGERRQLSETMDEYFVRIEPHLNGNGPTVAGIFHQFGRMMYGPVEPTYEAVDAIRGEVATLRKQLESRSPKKP